MTKLEISRELFRGFASRIVPRLGIGPCPRHTTTIQLPSISFVSSLKEFQDSPVGLPRRTRREVGQARSYRAKSTLGSKTESYSRKRKGPKSRQLSETESVRAKPSKLRAFRENPTKVLRSPPLSTSVRVIKELHESRSNPSSPSLAKAVSDPFPCLPSERAIGEIS
jgi:hypothetical protein